MIPFMLYLITVSILYAIYTYALTLLNNVNIHFKKDYIFLCFSGVCGSLNARVYST